MVKYYVNFHMELYVDVVYSSTPNNRADPNKRAGRKFQSLLIKVKGQMDTHCCLEYLIASKNKESIKKYRKTRLLFTFFEKICSIFG